MPVASTRRQFAPNALSAHAPQSMVILGRWLLVRNGGAAIALTAGDNLLTLKGDDCFTPLECRQSAQVANPECPSTRCRSLRRSGAHLDCPARRRDGFSGKSLKCAVFRPVKVLLLWQSDPSSASAHCQACPGNIAGAGGGLCRPTHLHLSEGHLSVLAGSSYATLAPI